MGGGGDHGLYPKGDFFSPAMSGFSVFEADIAEYYLSCVPT